MFVSVNVIEIKDTNIQFGSKKILFLKTKQKKQCKKQLHKAKDLRWIIQMILIYVYY